MTLASPTAPEARSCHSSHLDPLGVTMSPFRRIPFVLLPLLLAVSVGPQSDAESLETASLVSLRQRHESALADLERQKAACKESEALKLQQRIEARKELWEIQLLELRLAAMGTSGSRDDSERLKARIATLGRALEAKARRLPDYAKELSALQAAGRGGE
jgi:hypothetical protein